MIKFDCNEHKDTCKYQNHKLQRTYSDGLIVSSCYSTIDFYTSVHQILRQDVYDFYKSYVRSK